MQGVFEAYFPSCIASLLAQYAPLLPWVPRMAATSQRNFREVATVDLMGADDYDGLRLYLNSLGFGVAPSLAYGTPGAPMFLSRDVRLYLKSRWPRGNLGKKGLSRNQLRALLRHLLKEEWLVWDRGAWSVFCVPAEFASPGRKHREAQERRGFFIGARGARELER